jgi:hypothetical protein
MQHRPRSDAGVGKQGREPARGLLKLSVEGAPSLCELLLGACCHLELLDYRPNAARLDRFTQALRDILRFHEPGSRGDTLQLKRPRTFCRRGHPQHEVIHLAFLEILADCAGGEGRTRIVIITMASPQSDDDPEVPRTPQPAQRSHL